METVGLVMGVLMALFWMAYRMREAARPLSARKIIMPPLGMSTGAFMYVVPMFRPSAAQAMEAALLGLGCSAILIATTRLEKRQDGVYLRRSRAFVYILLGLFAARLGLKSYLRQSIPFQQLSGMFFLLALVMIAGWRIAMYFSYRRLSSSTIAPSAGVPTTP